MSSDVRKLFKQQQLQRKQQKRIDHPFAKYDGQGRLACAVCQTTLKSEALWGPHVQSSQHKQQLAHLQSIKQQQQKQTSSAIRKRTADPVGSDAALLSKRARFDELEREMREQEQDDQDSDDMSDDEPATALPTGFFDDDTPARQAAHATRDEPASTSQSMATGTQPDLPTGFFDDAAEEAKARKVAAPDVLAEERLEKEYADFMDQMQDVTEESQKMEEADEVTIQLERDLSFAQQQLAYDQRVKELKERRQQGKPSQPSTATSMPIDRDSIDPLWSRGMKSSVRQVMKKEVAKKTLAVFDDDMESSEEDDDWRAQQV
ncbi:hypothetical protein DM01DRAFT_1331992 [Hesseltinella vesiculosa]|uniref:Zinc finger protein 830 n=1 Tax=Hesseltinella vesiculosa TaxID=101127 RepID=A0A1X2GTS0_9FUNG|nr:hypothetical protein DM01DRAFT_1331992 [Hesseltinella vesiculosa]